MHTGMLPFFRSIFEGYSQKRLYARIRQQHPELAEVSDDDLINVYLGQATEEVVKAEAIHKALTPNEPFDTVLPSLFKDVMLFYASAPAASYALIAIKQQIKLDQLKANAELCGQQLELMKEAVSLHEQKEQRIQQVLDHYGINEQIIDRAESKLATDSIQLKNRTN